eukprot:XP_017946141.1 PREDICTED: uncharacterized protein LOC108645441 [Xenopus tropicalis]
MNVLLQLEQLNRETDPESGRVGVSLSESKSRFRSKSTFYPTHLRDNIVNMFQKNVETELSLLHETTSDLPSRNNLTMKEKRALNTLKNDHNIVIRKADKGGQIVILNKSDYVFEAHRQLSDRETYLPLEKSPLNIYASELDALLQEASSFNIIDDKLIAYIKKDTPKSAIFHHLPKIHKKERPPVGRPIIAGIGSLGENLCEFIDHFLQPLVLRLPSYLRDSGHLLHSLNNYQWNLPNLKWASIDVASLYSCIPHDLGLQAIEFHLNQYSTYDSNFITFLLKSIYFLLTHNFFYFDKKYYLQCRGTAMGAKFAPSYANLFLGWWEELHIYSENNHFSDNIQYYGRYIDDIIIIWSGTDEQFNDFIKHINTNNYNLQFTSEIHHTSINFLDITLSTFNHSVTSTIFRKECSANTLLEATSCHPRHSILNIPYSQFLRIRRICSEETEFMSQSTDLYYRLLDRGYPKKNIIKAFERAATVDRSSLFDRYKTCDSKKFKHKKNVHKKDNASLTCILTYSPQLNMIEKIINNNLTILKTDPILRQILNKGHRFVTRKTETLSNLLSPSLIDTDVTTDTWLSTKGCFKCGTRQCITCNYIHKTNCFISSTTLKKYQIKHFINCNTRNVIYLLTCTKCKMQYVGQTGRKLKDRIREHVLNITNINSHTTVAKHFQECSNRSLSFLQVTGIDRVIPNPRGGNISSILIRKETKWIFFLKTRQPYGLNFDYDVTCYV